MKETIVNVLIVVASVVSAVAIALIIRNMVLDYNLGEVEEEICNCPECTATLTLINAGATHADTSTILYMKDHEQD